MNKAVKLGEGGEDVDWALKITVKIQSCAHRPFSLALFGIVFCFFFVFVFFFFFQKWRTTPPTTQHHQQTSHKNTGGISSNNPRFDWVVVVMMISSSSFQYQLGRNNNTTIVIGFITSLCSGLKCDLSLWEKTANYRVFGKIIRFSSCFFSCRLNSAVASNKVSTKNKFRHTYRNGQNSKGRRRNHSTTQTTRKIEVSQEMFQFSPMTLGS